MKKLHEVNKSIWITLIAAILIVITMVYIWNRHYLATLEHGIAGEMSKQEKLLMEQGKLIVDLAKQKSPERISTIAREKLQMTYPKQEPVNLMKNSKQAK